jgi:hypothetical protein
MKKIEISKLDAAKRQLKTAINLYFSYGDPVSIHTLASAAREILYDLNKKHSGTSMLLDDHLMRDEMKKKYNKILRDPQNFFKHADRNPEGILNLNPDISPIFIYDAILKYQELTHETVPYFIIFRGWYWAHHPDHFFLTEEQKDTAQNVITRYGDDRLSYFSDSVTTLGL